MTTWYQIWPLTDEPAQADDAWYEANIESQRFPCRHFRPEPPFQNVALKDPGEDVALSFVSATSLLLLRVDLFSCIPFDKNPDVRRVALSWTGCEERKNIACLQATIKPRVRGNKDSLRELCKICGQFCYYPKGSRYILKQSLGSLPVYLDDLGGIIVNDEVFESLKNRKWKKVDIGGIKVLDRPRDGLPIDLETITADDLDVRGRSP